MKHFSRRIICAILAIIMVVSMAPNGVIKSSAIATDVQSTITTGSILVYGSYPQTKVTDSALITALNAQTLQADSTVTYDGSKYKKVYFTFEKTGYESDNGYNINTVYWFKFEPLQWRVLSNINGELFVMSEKILESRPYNQANASVTWETCTMRTWLNNYFYNTAFNSTEMTGIITSTVINADNPNWGTEGGNNTSDKLFLLSYADTINTTYGFSSSSSNSDTARRAQGTDFSKSNGLFVDQNSDYLGNSLWWLRTPNGYSNSACDIHGSGGSGSGSDGVHITYIGVRPAFKINLSSFSQIIFDSAGGSAVRNLVGNIGDSLPTLALTTRTGYTFAGWEPALPTTFPIGDFTTTAQWTPISYTITFDANGGSGSTTSSVAYGTVPTAPIVTRAYYTFAGWSPTITTVTGEATYIAQWTITTGVVITLGSYPQTKVTDNTLISALNLQILQSDSTVTYSGSKYKRVYFTATNSHQTSNGYNINTVYWFKFEPIQWRILSNTNDELFVIADKILDTKVYNQVLSSVTWETCTMRAWLNNDFYNTAFNPSERSRIITSNVVNADNPWSHTYGGNNTNDKIFFLSIADTINTDYGFSSSYDTLDTARKAQGTDYAKGNGLYSGFASNSEYWWLRSSGIYTNNATIIHVNGDVGYTRDVNYSGIGVRPALKIYLPSVIFTSSENSGCIVDYNNMYIKGLSAGVTSLDGLVNVANGYELTCIPTQNGFGTGTIANVTKDGIIINSYTIVIYGDVNGDSYIDSIDSGIIVDVENYAIPWETTTDAAYVEAGDLNSDGYIDSMDAGIAVDIENYILFVNQSSGVISVITAVAGSVVIKGLPKLGNILTADTTNITPTGATLTYMWKRSGEVVGTDKTYLITTEDIGKSITVTVTGFGAYSGGVRSSAVVATDAILSGTVTITGLAKFGEMLTANTSNIDPAAATVTYQWKRGGVNIGSESTYTITVEDIGQPITITVTGTGIYVGSITSAAVIPTKLNIAAPIAPTLQSVTTNSVTLNAVAGQEYKVNSGAWQSSAEFTGLHINTTYRFYTRVAETATHNASTSSNALSVTTNKEELTGAVAINGNPKVGLTLSVDSSGVLPSGATLSYVWKSGTLQIGTNSTYTVLDADIGESITVTVTGTGSYFGSLTSSAVVIIE